MIEWSRIDQLGFCFHLFDYNNDGVLCLQDLFEILKEVKDQDFVLREDVNKLIYILKQKGKNMRVENHISPITYGIYNKYECHEEPPLKNPVTLTNNPFKKGSYKKFGKNFKKP